MKGWILFTKAFAQTTGNRTDELAAVTSIETGTATFQPYKVTTLGKSLQNFNK